MASTAPKAQQLPQLPEEIILVFLSMLMSKGTTELVQKRKMITMLGDPSLHYHYIDYIILTIICQSTHGIFTEKE